MISERIPDDIPTQIKILNMIIPILFPLKLERCKPQKATHHPTKCDVINDVNFFPTEFTVKNCRRYPIRRRVTKSSALE